MSHVPEGRLVAVLLFHHHFSLGKANKSHVIATHTRNHYLAFCGSALPSLETVVPACFSSARLPLRDNQSGESSQEGDFTFLTSRHSNNTADWTPSACGFLNVSVRESTDNDDELLFQSSSFVNS